MFEPIKQPGDVVECGVVDTNHCGLPWPACLDGSAIVGAICVITNDPKYGRYQVLCDAISGTVLTEEQIEERRNNNEFDYYKKFGIDR